MSKRNIELKAWLRDRAHVESVCSDLGAVLQGHIRQEDTYFPVRQGRFKLRLSDPPDDYIVYYRRPDQEGPKGCDYIVESVSPSIKAALIGAFGVLAVVRKVRTLYFWQNVRIHLDEVEGLGKFIEFEAVLPDNTPATEQENLDKVGHLQRLCQIAPDDLIQTSYLEMVQP